MTEPTEPNSVQPRNLKEKKKLLEYYILEKQLQFIDSIKDDDGTGPEGEQSEVIKTFNDPFDEERQFDIDKEK